tara:strand:- start:151 stop:720 length:570 start_codon:yes stop_codon:yes gene_type:complete
MVEAVVKSGCFDKIIVSTDSNLIFDAVKDLPVERHVRPTEHATVRATALNAMINLMESIDKPFDEFAYFLPTCPFVSPDDISKGTNLLSQEVDFVVSMTQIPETLQLACLMKNGWVMPVFDNLECGLTNSKFIKKYYKPSGAFYMGKWNKILENKNFFKGSVKGVMIPAERSVDINTLEDIKFAEAMCD